MKVYEAYAIARAYQALKSIEVQEIKARDPKAKNAYKHAHRIVHQLVVDLEDIATFADKE